MTDKKKGLTPKEQDYEAMVADIQPTFQSQEPQQVVCPKQEQATKPNIISSPEICTECGHHTTWHFEGKGKCNHGNCHCSKFSQSETPDELLTYKEMHLLWNQWRKMSFDRELTTTEQLMDLISKAQLSKCHQSEAAIRADERKKMLAKVDKAGLTNWECYSKYFLDAKLEYMERVFAKQGNRNDIGGHTEEAAVSAGCTAVAKAQLQAIKDILEGE